MKKISVALSIALASMAFGGANAFADDASINVSINGSLQQFEQPPIIDNGNTMVPLRGIFEALGAKVTWNAENQVIDAQKDDKIIRLQIGWKHAWLGQTKADLEVAPEIVNGSTLVPVRFVSEALGANVQWDGNTRTVIISTNGSVAGAASTGTLGEGLADFAANSGLMISNWSVKMDKLQAKDGYMVTVSGKLTNSTNVTKSINWTWFSIRKDGQNTLPPLVQGLLGSPTFDLLPGDSADMNLMYEIPRGDVPSSYKMLVQANDGTLLNVSSLGGYTDITDYSLLTDSTYSYGRKNGFLQAVADDYLTAVDYFLAHGKTGKEMDESGVPVLKYAIDSNDTEMVETIIKAGADVNQSIEGQLPYQYAYSKASPDIMMLLEQYGARESGTATDAYTGERGLIKAATDGKADVVQQLLDSGIDPNTAPDGQTALMIAAENGFDDVVKVLLSKKANTEMASDLHSSTSFDLHWTPLMLAVYKGNPSTVQLLIDAKANINATDINGETPLMIAAEYDRLDKAKVLINAGANINATDKHGNSALGYAQNRFDAQDMVNLLKQAGAR